MDFQKPELVDQRIKDYEMYHETDAREVAIRMKVFGGPVTPTITGHYYYYKYGMSKYRFSIAEWDDLRARLTQAEAKLQGPTHDQHKEYKRQIKQTSDELELCQLYLRKAKAERDEWKHKYSVLKDALSGVQPTAPPQDDDDLLPNYDDATAGGSAAAKETQPGAEPPDVGDKVPFA